MVEVADAEAEDSAGQIERPDLTPPVAQNLVSARRSRDDLVDVLGRLSLSKDFLIARIGNAVRRCGIGLNHIVGDRGTETTMTAFRVEPAQMVAIGVRLDAP